MAVIERQKGQTVIEMRQHIDSMETLLRPLRKEYGEDSRNVTRDKVGAVANGVQLLKTALANLEREFANE